MTVQARGHLISVVRHVLFVLRGWFATVIRLRPRLVNDTGMTTAEYAVGTVAACGFAGLLFRLLTSDTVRNLLAELIKRALDATF